MQDAKSHSNTNIARLNPNVAISAQNSQNSKTSAPSVADIVTVPELENKESSKEKLVNKKTGYDAIQRSQSTNSPVDKDDSKPDMRIKEPIKSLKYRQEDFNDVDEVDESEIDIEAEDKAHVKVN